MAKEKKGKIPSIIELPSGSYRMQAWDNVAKRKVSFVGGFYVSTYSYI